MKYLLFNEGTSNLKYKEEFEEVKKTFEECSVVNVKDIDYKEFLSKLNKEDEAILFGGDGTLNYLINSLMNHDIHVPIGYIPGGSTNDFARSFDNTKTLEEKCEVIAGDHTLRYDIGLFNETRYFNYVAAFGAFTKASYSTNTNIKNMLGYGAYALSALASLPESFNFRQHIKVIHDGEETEGTFIYGGISNSLSIGGLKTPFKDTSLSDGYFEALMVKAPDNVGEVANILNDLASGHLESDYIYAFKAKDIRLYGEEDIAWTLDGEYGGISKDVHIEIIPSAIEIFLKK